MEWTDDECYEDIKRSFDEDMVKSMVIYYLFIIPIQNGTGILSEEDGIIILKHCPAKLQMKIMYPKLIGKIYYLLPLLLLLENGTNEAKWVGGLVFSMKKPQIIGSQNLKNFLAV